MKIYFRAGSNVAVKGDTEKKALMSKGLLARLRGIVYAEALNGHVLRFRLKDVFCREYQDDADWVAEEEKKKRAQEEASQASHCRRCGTNSPALFEFCPKCGSPLVKKDPRRIVPVGGN